MDVASRHHDDVKGRRMLGTFGQSPHDGRRQVPLLDDELPPIDVHAVGRTRVRKRRYDGRRILHPSEQRLYRVGAQLPVPPVVGIMTSHGCEEPVGALVQQRLVVPPLPLGPQYAPPVGA
jgi:hypothetical protein